MAENTVPNKDVTTRSESESVPSTRESGRYLMPAVDIYETEDNLVLLADLPGVKRENLDVGVDDDILTIEGCVDAEQTGEMVRGEYELHDYFRQFRLSEAIDQEKISAELKQGVLRVELPKAERAKPKQIEVNIT